MQLQKSESDTITCAWSVLSVYNVIWCGVYIRYDKTFRRREMFINSLTGSINPIHLLLIFIYLFYFIFYFFVFCFLGGGGGGGGGGAVTAPKKKHLQNDVSKRTYI